MELFISWGKKNSYKTFTKNQSKKLLQCNLIWINIIKFKNSSESPAILKLKTLLYQNIYMFHSILEFEQSWNFFHQLYNYSKKILYDTQQNIYLVSAQRDLQNGVKILVKF